ncbi:MAG: hypoxanthine phosphoribosyltransferase [Candidatus Gastranaerophilales bacterium]|nr:hypoxanthine phosphoribosyltransferase [Candidatus Gastranaerophilales bacterium]
MKILKEDIKPLFSEEEIQLRVKEVAREIDLYYKDEEVYVICVLKGSVMFTVDLVKSLTVPIKMEFIRLSSYGSSTTTTGKVHAVDISLPDLNDKHVLVIEDIVDTGLTAKFLLDFINNNFHTKTTKFCSLLDKKCFRRTEIEPDYVGFNIDNKFVIGYGLDYDGQFRNMPYIGYVEIE